MIDKYKISADEFKKVSFSRIATRPNNASKFGDGKMSATELKERFDAPNHLFREKFNQLVQLIVGSEDGDSLSAYISTGIGEGKSLKRLFEDITSDSAAFASYLNVGSGSLLQKLIEMEDTIEKVETLQSEALEKILEIKVSEAAELFAQKAAEVARRTAFSNALKNSVSGETLRIDDVSPLAHDMAVMVRGKNLCDNIWEPGGIYQDNGTEFLSSTGIRSAHYHAIRPNTVYTVSKCGVDVSVRFRFYDKDKSYIGYKLSAMSVGTTARAFTSEKNAYFVRFDIVSANAGDVLIQIEEGSTATAYAPYVEDISAVKVYAQGKNIFDGKLEKGGIYQDTGIENGFSTCVRSANYHPITPNTEYTLSKHGLDVSLRFRFYDKDKNYIGYIVSSLMDGTASKTFKTQSNAFFVRFQINSTTATGVLLQLEEGTIATDYEAYIEPIECSVNADGNANGAESIHPTTTLFTDTEGAVITAQYNRDINKAYAELVNVITALGGNV